MPPGPRRGAYLALQTALSTQGVLAALLLTPEQVVAVATPKRQPMHPDDLFLLTNFVRASESFRRASFPPYITGCLGFARLSVARDVGKEPASYRNLTRVCRLFPTFRQAFGELLARLPAEVQLGGLRVRIRGLPRPLHLPGARQLLVSTLL